MSSSAINAQLFQAKIGSIQNQADSSGVYSNGQWSFKNSTALTSVTITDAGNVGVGVTLAPWASRAKGVQFANGNLSGALTALDSGLVQFTTNAYTAAATDNYISAGAATRYYQFAGTHVWENAASGAANGTITFTERMRIDAIGALTVGSSGSTISHTIQAPSNPAGTAAVHVRKQNVAINSGGNSYIEFYGASGGYDGYLGVTGTTLTVIDASDSRKKENVRPANYGLKEIKELKPVVYDWKEEFGGEKDVKGFLAQEVKQVLPECVTIKDETDAGGFSDSHFLGTANMIPVLVAAIQELSAKVDAQAEEIKALKAQP